MLLFVSKMFLLLLSCLIFTIGGVSAFFLGALFFAAVNGAIELYYIGLSFGVVAICTFILSLLIEKFQIDRKNILKFLIIFFSSCFMLGIGFLLLKIPEGFKFILIGIMLFSTFIMGKKLLIPNKNDN